MRLTTSQQHFLDSPEAAIVRETLQAMLEDPNFNTQAGYNPESTEDTSFIDKHLLYLSTHPKLDPLHYVANLRLKTRLRR